MLLPVDELVNWFWHVLWTFLRIGGFLMVVPIFGNQLIPRRVRLAMAWVMSVAIAPILDAPPVMDGFDLGVMLNGGMQLFAGIALGFATIMFFQVFVISGQFIAMQMGLGFAAMVDPGNGVQVTIWSQFFLMLVTLLFISMNGHLVLLSVLVEGFRVHPLGINMPIDELAGELVQLGSWMFMGGVMIAMPAVISLLVVNIAFGVISRAAPQLNVFSLGFPFSLLFGLVIVWVMLAGWQPHFESLANELFQITAGWVQ